MSDELKIEHTARGFARADFVDQYNEPCSIQKSSLATGDCIWLGMNKGTHHQGECLARMQLNQEMVAALIPILQRFVDTGEIDEIQDSGD